MEELIIYSIIIFMIILAIKPKEGFINFFKLLFTGYDEDGLDWDKCDKRGFYHDMKHNHVDSNGMLQTINKYTGTYYDVNGYNYDGYDKYGYDRYGFNRSGIHKSGSKYNEDGIDMYGFDHNGMYIENGDK